MQDKDDCSITESLWEFEYLYFLTNYEKGEDLLNSKKKKRRWRSVLEIAKKKHRLLYKEYFPIRAYITDGNIKEKKKIKRFIFEIACYHLRNEHR